MAKWGILLVTSGVVTAVAVEFIMKYARDTAILAARAEMQQLMLAAAAKSQAQTPQTVPSPVESAMSSNTVFL